jgi:hypothetical protein
MVKASNKRKGGAVIEATEQRKGPQRQLRLLGRAISSSQGLYLDTEQHKHRIIAQTSMPQKEFELLAPVFERAKAVHILDQAATVIGLGYVTA